MLALGVAFVVSLPYSGPILWRYAFHVRNPYPSIFAAPQVELAQIPRLFLSMLSVSTGIALFGLGALLLDRKRGAEHRIALAWPVVGAALLLQNYVWQVLIKHGFIWASIAPGHHALVQLGAVKCALFGYGVLRLDAYLRNRLHRIPPDSVPRLGWPGAVLLAGFLVALYPHYAQWNVLTMTSNRTQYAANYERNADAYQWIKAHTRVSDTFLCDDELGVTLVSPAGRKVVATMLFYSNPYVDCQPRMGARNELFDALRAGDAARFHALAQQWKVDYVLLRDRLFPDAAAPSFLACAYYDASTRIFAVR
jgi:hypothetical protein